MSVDWQSQILNSLDARDLVEKANDDFFISFQLSAKRVQELETKLDTIQKTDLQIELANKLAQIEELTTGNKSLEDKSQSEQEKSRNLAKTAMDLERNLKILRDAYTQLDKKFKTLKEETRHNFKNIESINDEVLSLQIENNVLNSKNQALRDENDQLIQRWLAKVEKDAQFLNDAMKDNEKQHK